MHQYTVVFKKSALKELRELPARMQQKFLDAAQLLSLNPFTELLNIKKLRGFDGLFRLRIQDYRMIYSIENDVLKIVVVKIGHRRDVYD
jgi:mRNA interferase RelE/StbE